MRVLPILQILVVLGGNYWVLLFVSFSGGFAGPSRAVKTVWRLSMAAEIGLLAAGFLLPLRYAPIWLSLTCLCLLTPKIVHSLAARTVQSDQKKAHREYLDELETMERRLGSKMPLSAEEALRVLQIVDGADQSWRSWPDYTDRARAALKRALDAGIIDPNSRMNDSGVPLSTCIYEAGAPHRFASESQRRRMAWMLRALIDAGAVVTRADSQGRTIADYLEELERSRGS